MACFLFSGDDTDKRIKVLSGGEKARIALAKTIISKATDYLNPQAWLLLEHGYDQAPAVCELLRQNGFNEVQSRNDLAGIARCSGGMRAEVK